MKVSIDTRGSSKVAIIESEAVLLSSEQDALDFMADIQYNYETNKLLVYKESLPDDFLVLSTTLAGSILQKYVNYDVKLAIVGDFSAYDSKALQDFIRECNRGKDFFFLPTTAEALDKLHTN